MGLNIETLKVLCYSNRFTNPEATKIDYVREQNENINLKNKISQARTLHIVKELTEYQCIYAIIFDSHVKFVQNEQDLLLAIFSNKITNTVASKNYESEVTFL